jgi:glycosyltransferase involved in cell wall biosynthesis
MRIAQIATLAERIPPRKYGGTERVVYTLTEELVKRGHDVTLFASGDSITSAKLVSVYPRGLRESKAMESHGFMYSMLNMGIAYDKQDQFDIIHDHNAHFTLPTANIARTPTVITLHGPFDHINRPYFRALSKNINLVAISKKQAERAPELHIANVIHNGLYMENYPFEEEHDGYLLYVGRLSREKGVHHAIEVAQILDIPLLMAAKLDSGDISYFNEKIGPKLSDQIRWIGEVDEIERNKLMSRAMCTLHPTNWPEPFGLTLIEAMACGSPVVAYNQGSIPEIIRHGKTGYVIDVDDIEGMINAVSKIKKIKRIDCRNHALTKFSGEKMGDAYEELYTRILTKKKQSDTPVSRRKHLFPYLN